MSYWYKIEFGKNLNWESEDGIIYIVLIIYILFRIIRNIYIFKELI